MFQLIQDRWRQDVLDVHRGPGQVRVAVRAWRTLRILDDVFVEPARPGIVRDYVRAFGLRQTARKVRSRLFERGAHHRVTACGVGVVLESPDGAGFAPGTIAFFIATNHPAMASRLVVEPLLMRSVHDDDEALSGVLESETILAVHEPAMREAHGAVEDVCGWDAASGVALEAGVVSRALDEAWAVFEHTSWQDAERFALDDSPVRERAPRSSVLGGGLRATLFGYGHYARTCVLPIVREWAEVTCIHEIDPGLHDPSLDVAWDSAPGWRDGEAPDVALIAGFHHTHAPLAAEAARRGCAVVVEKPVATTHEDLDALLDAARTERVPVFAAFQKRYAQETEWLREDLALRGEETPCDYACIVHEIALPERHWYRWPVSGSRALSNGCHWLDHFLVLNGFSPVRHIGAHASASGTIVAHAELENGACFSMTLSDRGSGRLGTRELVEVTSRGRTARIEDMRSYVAEDARRVLRRASLDKHAAYANMYRAIGRALTGHPLETFDTLEALERTSRAALVLDACIRRELS